MSTSFIKILWGAAGALFFVSAFLVRVLFGADTAEAGAQVKQVRVEKLSNVPGKSITAVVVNYAPGGKSGKHHHAGGVFRLRALFETQCETEHSGRLFTTIS